MNPHTILVLSYIAFAWLVILHTFEEISAGIMDAQIGRIRMTSRKYLIAAGMISTVNLGTLALIAAGSLPGYYLGFFTTAIFGILQAGIHIYGYFHNRRSARGLGAGIFSSIPLAIVALLVFVQLVNAVFYFP